MLGAWSGLVYLFLYLPIVFVAVYSFNSGRRLQRWAGFGTEWYGRALANESIRTAVAVSVQAAAATAVLSVVLGWRASRSPVGAAGGRGPSSRCS
jgi:ABC-type spermidine/putrescine transport system permease subunit II